MSKVTLALSVLFLKLVVPSQAGSVRIPKHVLGSGYRFVQIKQSTRHERQRR